MEWWQAVQELFVGPKLTLIFRCLQVSVDLLCVVLVTDFASGVLHWLEDGYGRANWPITGKLITIPNIIHHHNPRYFTQHTWRKSAGVLLGMGAKAERTGRLPENSSPSPTSSTITTRATSPNTPGEKAQAYCWVWVHHRGVRSDVQRAYLARRVVGTPGRQC